MSTLAHRSHEKAARIMALSLEEGLAIVCLLALDTTWPEITTRLKIHRDRRARAAARAKARG